MVDAGDVLGGDIPQCSPQARDTLAGQAVEDAGSLPAGVHQSGPGQRSQVVRRIGHRLTQLLSDLFDGALALCQHVDDLGPPAAGQCLGYLGERVKQCILRLSITHAYRLSFAGPLCQVFI
jgi:hypothetical protein